MLIQLEIHHDQRVECKGFSALPCVVMPLFHSDYQVFESNSKFEHMQFFCAYFISDSVGAALEDYSSLRLLHDLAKEDNFGTFVQLVPELENPKDPFTPTKGGRMKGRLRRVA